MKLLVAIECAAWRKRASVPMERGRQHALAAALRDIADHFANRGVADGEHTFVREVGRDGDEVEVVFSLDRGADEEAAA